MFTSLPPSSANSDLGLSQLLKVNPKKSDQDEFDDFIIEDDVHKKAIKELLMAPAETESDTSTQKASKEVLMSESTSESTNDQSAQKAVQELTDS